MPWCRTSVEGYELAVVAPVTQRVAVAFDELALVI
jgi:hypothetical protein